MKIGIDCRLWNETGVGRYIRNLVQQLQIIDKKNEYVLFMRSIDAERFKVQSSKFKVKMADTHWHTLEEQIKFPQVINRENLDLMHFPYFSVPVFYNKSFVVTIHDLIINHFPTGQASTLSTPIYNLKLLAYKFVIRQAAKKAKKILTVSNATKEEIVDHLRVEENKVVVTYEGVDDKIRNPKSEIRNNFQSTRYKILNTKYFLYVGNAYPHKNLEKLLETFYSFCHPELVSGSQLNLDSDLRQNDIKLVLVGKEDYFYKRLKEKVKRMDISKKIIFLQNISDEELSNLYKNALGLIMPSLMEGFGLPALEAMANNCLVLASNIPALKEVCGDAAIYFDPYNIKDLEKKMREVCFNDLPRGKAGLNHFSEKKKKGLERVKLFSWQKMAKETLKIYESCVGL